MSIHVLVTAVIYHTLNGSAGQRCRQRPLVKVLPAHERGWGQAEGGPSKTVGVAPGGPSVWSRKTLAPEEGPWGQDVSGCRDPSRHPGASGGGVCLTQGPGKACPRH